MVFRCVALCAAVAMLTACSATRLLATAEQNMRQSEYEQAMDQYAEAQKRFPADANVRIAVTRAKGEAIGRLTATAVALRQSGRLTDAELVVRRALAMDPANERVKAVRSDIERDMRSMSVVDKANQLIAAGERSSAMQILESGLRENPGHQDLAALQRRLAAEERAGAQTSSRLLTGQPLTLQFRDANLKPVLEALARFSEINFVLDRDVRPDLRVTIFIRDAPLADALEVLATTNQLAIKVIDPTTALLYPNTPEKQREYQELVVRAFYLSNADARQTAAMLRSVLKLREIFVDEKLNFLVLREPPEAIRLAERLVSLHDAGDAEVLLDVEVLEVQRQRLLELGVRFPDTFSLTPLAAAGGGTQLTVDDLRNLNSSRVAVGVPPVVVNLRREVGDASVLANPKIRVRNREKARVLIGDRVPVVTSTATASGFVSENIQYLDVGLKLEVEPQVFMGDDIAIKVGLEVSSLSREITTRSGSLAYQIGTRNASTALRLRDGETQLLAGLISTEDRAAANRVPGLGDLPVLGRLFSSQLDRSNRSEIVLSITPRLVRGTGRPDIGDLEFASGTEAALRVRSVGQARFSRVAENRAAPTVREGGGWKNW